MYRLGAGIRGDLHDDNPGQRGVGAEQRILHAADPSRWHVISADWRLCALRW